SGGAGEGTGTGTGGEGTGTGSGGEFPGGEGTGTGENQVDGSTEGFESGERSPGEEPKRSSEEESSRSNRIIIVSLLAILALLLLFLGGMALWSWWKKRRKRERSAKEEVVRETSRAREQGRFIYLTYKKMCEELAGVGLSREKSETPDEFLARVRSTYPSAVKFASPISAALEDTLYGMRPIDLESLRGLDACLQHLRELCQGIKSSAGKAWR
ncbi:MAG: DUF4129 domain-containing protein, partial [Actinobacteria bacterium]|nr:DUF4129 domain-containing protein [Actinomycetota bacterium]